MSLINGYNFFLQKFSIIFSINNKIRRIISLKVHSNREKIIKLLKIKTINSIFSACIRILNKFLINKLVLTKEFLIIKIGFSRIFEYYPFLNFDYFFRESFALEKIFNEIIDIRNINLNKESCEEIEIRHVFDYIPKKSISLVMQRWKDLLIPGGKLIISFNEKNLKKFNYSIENLFKLLRDLNFKDISLDIEGISYKLSGYKKKDVSKKIYPKILLNKKYLEILSNNECLIIVDNKDAVNSKKIFSSDILKQINKNLRFIDKRDLNSDNFLQYLENIEKINHLFLIRLLEYNFVSSYAEIFRKIILKFRGLINIHLFLPNKDIDAFGYLQYFNKGIIAKICDNNKLNVDRIELNENKKSTQYSITISIKKDKVVKKEKICCLGYYSVRYSQLGYHWDGQVRAFDYLGYIKNLYLDLRNENFFSLKKKIFNYNPKILWVGLEEYLPFLEYIKNDIKERDITVIYWYEDMFEPKYLPHLGEIIDFIFLTNAQHIPLYKKNYNVEKVFYMPQACTPPFMNYHHLKEIYDIGFAGKRDILFRPKDLRDQKFYYDHNSRTILLHKLAHKYNVKYVDGEYNDISEFYSCCKFVFGGTPHLANFDLYISNRFFIAGGCGAVHLTSYFKGVEKLVENEKHVLWFKNETEMHTLIDKYINNKKERTKIRENAIDLFHKKHTYINRVQNMLDIINEKTTEFYGYL